MSPTALTLRQLRSMGYPLVEVVERWIPGANVRRDLFGFGDVFAIDVDGAIKVIQATSHSNISSRVKKIRESEALGAVSSAGISVVVWGWRKRDNRWVYTEVDINTGASTRKTKLDALVEMTKVQTDECIRWPFAKIRQGYGTVTINNKTVGAHVASCTIVHGPKPSDDLEVAHSCGVRDCVNPRHLRWATRVENAADREKHGTVLRGKAHPRYKSRDVS